MDTSVEELTKMLKRYGSVTAPYKDVLVVHSKPEYVRELTEILYFKLGGRYATSIGVDERPLDGMFHVYHVFAFDEHKLYVVINASIPSSHPVMPSITRIVDGANWAEREIMDMLGIKFNDHPEPYRLVLPYDWPDKVYPLRKDFSYSSRTRVEDAVDEIEYASINSMKRAGELRKKHTLIPLGPYHPALHEPEYFELYVEGEKIVDARYKGFFVHRGLEKIAEEKLTYNQVPFIAERVCGICGFTHSTAYCQAVEYAAGIDVPERAKFIRSILLELERLHSHLLWFGVLFHVLGFDTGFMAMWRLREDVMMIAELLTGNRKMYGMNLIGGVRRDVREESFEKIRKVLERIERDFKDYVENVLSMNEIMGRIRGIGILPRNDAHRISVVGPVARASGIYTDTRKHHPYAAYRYVDFSVPVYSDCDVYSRLLVHYDEVFESINIIRQLLDNMPDTPIIAEVTDIPGNRMGIGVTEAPRGENIHFVITGGNNHVYRWRIRAATFNNLPSISIMLRGEYLADAPVIITSLDPCFSCTDRITVVDVRSGVKRVIRLRYGMRV